MSKYNGTRDAFWSHEKELAGIRRVLERFEFRGIPGLMEMRLTCLEWDDHYTIELNAKVPDVLHSAADAVTIAIQRPIHREDLRRDKRPGDLIVATVRMLVHDMMRHEAAEGLWIDGARLEDPHADRI